MVKLIVVNADRLCFSRLFAAYTFLYTEHLIL